MLSRLLGIVVVVLTFAHSSAGFEVGAVVRTIDAEKRIALVFANGKERTVKTADDARVLNEDGKDLPGGLGAKEPKEGATVTRRRYLRITSAFYGRQRHSKYGESRV